MQKFRVSSFDRFDKARLVPQNIEMLRFITVVLCTIAVVHCATVGVTLPVRGTEDKPIAILHQDSAVNPDGSHYNVWESENGIKVQEEGNIKMNDPENVVHSVNGKISYNDDKGNPIVLTYVADENGYQPQGDHLPTPPPVPASIARALEYIAAHPYVEKEYSQTIETV